LRKTLQNPAKHFVIPQNIATGYAAACVFAQNRLQTKTTISNKKQSLRKTVQNE